MAGNELKTEISKYLGIPYFSNTRHLPKNNVWVGKGTAKEIALETIDIANKQGLRLLDLTSQQIYNLQKKHGLGIDCSGLVCNLLNSCFSTHLDVRKTSADMLTSPPISTPVLQPKSGDLIRLDSGKHVVLIVEVTNDMIIYVHSSDKTAIRGVHYATVSLDFKDWSDTTLTHKPYSTLFNPKKGDGIFRVNS